jgi:hypothetical protein
MDVKEDGRFMELNNNSILSPFAFYAKPRNGS